MILKQWIASQSSPHTRSCYERDANRLLAHVGKPLRRVGLGDLQGFDDALVATGMAPASRVRTLAAVKSLFGFCCRMRYLRVNPATELRLRVYEKRLAERIVPEQDVQKLLAADMSVRDQVLLDHRSLNNYTFIVGYVLIGHALPEEAQGPAVHRRGTRQT